jgi:hypothetical protein
VNSCDLRHVATNVVGVRHDEANARRTPLRAGDNEQETFMALPTLTPEQRAQALEKAQQARKERSELLAALKAGSLGLGDVLTRTDDIVKKTKVLQVLKALPGYGPAKAAAVMEEAGIDDKRRVGGLGEQQRRKLLENVSG